MLRQGKRCTTTDVRVCNLTKYKACSEFAEYIHQHYEPNFLDVQERPLSNIGKKHTHFHEAGKWRFYHLVPSIHRPPWPLLETIFDFVGTGACWPEELPYLE